MRGSIQPRRAMLSWSDWDDGMVDSLYDSIYDDDDLEEEVVVVNLNGSGEIFRPKSSALCWQTVNVVLAKIRHALPKGGKAGEGRPADDHFAGHAANFRMEEEFVLKALCRGEAEILGELQEQPGLRDFVPRYHGCVERDDQTWVKMQNVLLSMDNACLMDIKLGVRTFQMSELGNDKRRMDLLEKALVIQEHNPTVEITDDELEHGITKCRFMALRDRASSSSRLGFRVQGMRKGTKLLKSKDFANMCSEKDCRLVFSAFFEDATEAQRQQLLARLRALEAAAAASDWFARHEFIGSSLLVVYDAAHPERCGIWMIDFARTTLAPAPLQHTVPWAEASHEDGYLLGVQSLLRLWDAPPPTPKARRLAKAS